MSRGSQRAAITEARRLLRAREGPPTEADRPRHNGRLPRVLDGQLDLEGRIHRADGSLEEFEREREQP
jgi:hypothetical protein